MKKTILLFIILSSIASAQTGWLQITSNSTGAQVYVDGQYKGTIPLDLIELSAGNHTVELKLENFESQRLSFRIKHNEIEPLVVNLVRVKSWEVKPEENQNLEQEKGKLTIITTPSDATVSIDGVKVNAKNTPLTVQKIGAGKHTVNIRKYMQEPLNDYFEKDFPVIVRPNQTTLLKVNLNDYLKQGHLIIESNLKKQEAKLYDLHYNKVRSLLIPSTWDFLSSDYRIEWFDTKTNNFNFTLLADRNNHLFITFRRDFLNKKTVQDHIDFMSSEKYVKQNYTLLDEYGYKKILGLSDDELGAKFAVWSIFGAMPIALGLATDGNLYKGAKIGLITGGTIISIWMTKYIFEWKDEKYKIIKNIKINRERKADILREYDQMLNKWEKEIEEENKIIKKKNEEIEQYNNNLPKPSISYEK